MRIPNEAQILALLGNINIKDDNFIKKVEEQIDRIKSGKTWDEVKKECCGDKLKKAIDAQNKIK